MGGSIEVFRPGEDLSGTLTLGPPSPVTGSTSGVLKSGSAAASEILERARGAAPHHLTSEVGSIILPLSVLRVVVIGLLIIWSSTSELAASWCPCKGQMFGYFQYLSYFRNFLFQVPPPGAE